MRIPYIIWVLLITALSCKTNPTNRDGSDKKTEERKTRLELVKEFPFRSGDVKGIVLEKPGMLEFVKEVESIIDSSTQTLLFYVTTKGAQNRVEEAWPNGHKAIWYSYELWKEFDIEMTVVRYPSFSINAVTGFEEEFCVYEIEHKDLTGTCRYYFNPTDMNGSLDFQYHERN